MFSRFHRRVATIARAEIFLLGFGLLLVLTLAACGPETAVSNAIPPKPTATKMATAVPPTPTATPIPPTPTPLPNCETPATPAAPLTDIPTYTYRILNQYPHDPDAFTQGLFFADGFLYESTGIKRTGSSLREVELETGAVLRYVELSDDFFGEGLALWQDRLIQLTWTSQTAFVYDRDSFERVGQFTYDTVGWGLTDNGRCLIMSDGTATLYFRDPDTFAELGRLEVFDANGPVTNLNELEFVNGEILANVWLTNQIARVSPETGQVTGWIDLTGLLDPATVTDSVDVLNGIAYDAENGRLFVTGKLWPTLFEIELLPQ